MRGGCTSNRRNDEAQWRAFAGATASRFEVGGERVIASSREQIKVEVSDKAKDS